MLRRNRQATRRLYAAGLQKESSCWGLRSTDARRNQVSSGVEPLRFNSGRPLTNGCDHGRDSGFDADKILGFAAHRAGAIRSSKA